MAVAFRCAGGNGSGATAQTSYVVNKPTSPTAVQDGDVMYLFLSFVQSGTITPPAGWTSIAGPQNAPSGSMRHQLFRKVASAEPATWTFTNSVSAKWYAEVWVGSGIDNTTPEYSATITSMSGAAPFVTAGVAPNATADAWGVYMCGADCSVALSWSTDQTDRHTANSGSGSSNLNGGSADTNGILSGTETAGFTPSPLSLQGGAMASFGVNAGPTIDIFTSSDTWTCPAGVTTATIRCWGGGGAGGGGSVSGAAGGGGAGGSFATSSISVTPGNNYTVTVGAGGSPDTTPSTNGATHPGGDSWFGTTGTVLAQGGAGGGDRSSSGNGTAGSGSTASSVGTTLYAGGSGAAGSSGSIGGGGGGGAGTTGAGGSASGSTAGSGTPFFGGAGTIGTNGSNASTASLYGGGGGGARANSNTDRVGGAGAAGRVEVEYVVATSVSANAGAAAGTAAGLAPTITDTVSVAAGGPALVTASAKTPTTTLTCSPVAGVAQVTAAALAPTLTAASNIPAGAAAATGSAKDPTITDTVSIAAGLAEVTAAANDPTVTMQSSASPDAGLAEATAVAGDPLLTLTLSVTPDEAAATADAYGTTITDSDSVPTDTAQAVGVANSPTLTLTSGGSPDAAEVTAEALSPTVSTASMIDAAAGLVEAQADASGPMMIGVAAATAEAGDLVPPNAVAANAAPAAVQCVARGVSFDVIIFDVASATSSALDVVGLIEVAANAGVAEATAELGDTDTRSVVLALADVASGTTVDLIDPAVQSSSNPQPGCATVTVVVRQPGLGIGSGEPSAARVTSIVFSATAHVTGGSSAERRVLRVGLTAERTYRIPYETRTVKVGRT